MHNISAFALLPHFERCHGLGDNARAFLIESAAIGDERFVITAGIISRPTPVDVGALLDLIQQVNQFVKTIHSAKLNLHLFLQSAS